MRQNLDISIIIPTYNRVDFYSECINSLTQLEGLHYEVIVVDASNDSAKKQLIERITNKHIYVSCKTPSVSYQRNVGLLTAKGEYIMFLDSDDVINFQKKEQILVSIKNGFDASYSNWEMVDELENLIKKDGEDVTKWFKSILMYTNIAPLHSYIFKRNKLNRIGGFDEEVLAAEDWDLILRLNQIGVKFYHFNAETVKYRMHPQNSSKNYSLMLKECIKVIDKHYNSIGNLQHPVRVAAICSQFAIAYYNINSNAEREKIKSQFVEMKMLEQINEMTGDIVNMKELLLLLSNNILANNPEGCSENHKELLILLEEKAKNSELPL